MVNLETIENEIIELEKHDTSYATIERLAWCYIVRDHLKQYEPDQSTGDIIGGNFCQLCSNVPMQSLMGVLEEHMQAIELLYPKEYTAICERIKSL